MKRTREQILEDESRQALRQFLPLEWIVTDKFDHDHGIDIGVQIVKNGEITNKVLWIQLKATRKEKSPSPKGICYQMKTKHLRYYEECRLPVVIIFWIQPAQKFYYLFVQKYIKENLSYIKPTWRKQKSVTIVFPADTELKDARELDCVATDGYFYVIENELRRKSGLGPFYWIDGIPQSDDAELKERFLKAMRHLCDEDYTAAIKDFKDAMKYCAISPREKTAMLISMGTAYSTLGQYNKAMENYRVAVKLLRKLEDADALVGKASLLNNIARVYAIRGQFDKALRCLEDSLSITRKIDDRRGEALTLLNIGHVNKLKSELNVARKYYSKAYHMFERIGDTKGVAMQLMHIGLIYMNAGHEDQALKNFQSTLRTARILENTELEAAALGNIGLIHHHKGKITEALKYHRRALKLFKKIGIIQGEAEQNLNIGLVYKEKGELQKAMRYYTRACTIFKQIGYRKGEAQALGNIGFLYAMESRPTRAIIYSADSLKIFKEIGDKQGERKQSRNIELILQFYFSAKGK